MRSLMIVSFILLLSFSASSQKVICDYTVSNTCQNDTVWFVDKSVASGGAVLSQIHIFFGDNDASGVPIDAYMKPGSKVFHIYKNPGKFTITAIAKADPNAGSNANPDETQKAIQVFAQPALELQYPQGKLIYTGQSKPIWAVAAEVDNDKAVWSTGFVGKTLDVSKPGRYKVTVTDKNGCRNWAQSDSMMVKDTVGVGYQIEVVNNVLTPNGDGFDDYLIVKNIETFANPVILQIFNSWGQKVFETPDYRDDCLNGKFWVADKVEAGTFYYIIKSKSKRGTTGYVDVIK